MSVLTAMSAICYDTAMQENIQSSFTSRLPKLGTTIFSVMSAMAAKYNAVNLGQGFPDFACDPLLITSVDDAMREGHNQYPMMSGAPMLRHAISEKITSLYGRTYDAEHEITVTAGATQALFTAILCCVQPGDEVIVLEPAYDSYIPAILLAGGTVKTIPLTLQRTQANDVTGYQIPFEKIAAALSSRTRLLIINTPHNPTGCVWSRQDMERLAEILKGSNTLICSDEVYEHIIFDGLRHESVARHADLAERSFVISSFGKSFHVTGWKVGYVAAPAWLMAEFRKVHQYNVFTVNTPMQHGIAHYMKDAQTYLNLPAFYQQKRDFFRQALASTRFRLLPCEGTYFQSVDYSQLQLPEAKLSERNFAEFLTREIGVAAIPVSVFYNTPHDERIIRFCFAKKEETLKEAIARLSRL